MPYARRTLRATARVEKILIGMSGRKGSHIAGIIHLPESVFTCLRIVESLNIPACSNAEVVGIDGWAKRKGINYGAIIVNIKTGHPIDLIDSRKNTDVVIGYHSIPGSNMSPGIGQAVMPKPLLKHYREADKLQTNCRQIPSGKEPGRLHL